MDEVIKEVKELKKLIKQKKISPGIAARFIECSERQVYRWVQGISTPSMIYRKAIRQAIHHMKEDL